MNILTFDIEEWFHILDNESTKSELTWSNYPIRIEKNVYRILELLQTYDQKATFFCLGWVAEKYPMLVRQIFEQGHEIGTHSYAHQLVYEQSLSSFEDDLDRSIKVLEDVTGYKVRAYRAPGFSIVPGTEAVFELLAHHGIEIDCSIFPSSRAHGGYPDYGEARPTIIDFNGIRLKEFPINTYSFAGKEVIFSGGGYFRFFPYKQLRRMFINSPYVMTYFHPRDFDPGQPLIKELSMLRRFKSYYGLGTSFYKLKSILEEFKFYDLGSAEKNVNWYEVDIVNFAL